MIKHYWCNRTETVCFEQIAWLLSSFQIQHQLEPAIMLAQSNPSLPPLAANAIAIDLCRTLYILPLSSRQTIKTDHLLFWTFLKISHFICNINSSGFSINCFHSPQNLATVAPSKTLWSAPILTWEGKYYVRFDRLISSISRWLISHYILRTK